MILIQNNNGRFFAGTYSGLPIRKSHHSRAMIYQTEGMHINVLPFLG